jgi:hypothetical protein
MSLNFRAWKKEKMINKRVLIWRCTFVKNTIEDSLDLGFWEILKPLKLTNITIFFLIKTNG